MLIMLIMAQENPNGAPMTYRAAFLASKAAWIGYFNPCLWPGLGHSTVRQKNQECLVELRSWAAIIAIAPCKPLGLSQ